MFDDDINFMEERHDASMEDDVETHSIVATDVIIIECKAKDHGFS